MADTTTTKKIEQKSFWKACATAFSRADWYKPLTVWLAANEYAVLGSDKETTYHVILTDKNAITGEEQCTCPAGQSGMVCYHVARAIRYRENDHEGQIFPAGLEMTTHYQESAEEAHNAQPATCLKRGCQNVVSDYGNAFCDDCALDVAMDYADVHEPF